MLAAPPEAWLLSALGARMDMPGGGTPAPASKLTCGEVDADRATLDTRGEGGKDRILREQLEMSGEGSRAAMALGARVGAASLAHVSCK